ncbi:MAG: tetratricopeptide repeat protein, partial [Desulfobacterales bacterium]|nr:tetratricopeptide repeat protein [Desulfobacterales bacterium]
KEIIKDHPRNIRAAMELGQFYHRTGRTDAALELFKELGRRSKTEFEVVLRLVQLYIDPDRFEDALPIVEGMLAAAPENPELHHLAGLAFSGIRENDQAIAHFKQVKPESRFHQDAVIHMVYLYQEAEKYDEATRYMKEAALQAPENMEFKYYLAALYEEQEKYQEAEDVLK